MTTAIITGGSRGFGLALAADLASDGWHVIVDGRDRDRLRAAVGVLLPGSDSRADRMSSRASPTRWAARMKAMRRRTSRW